MVNSQHHHRRSIRLAGYDYRAAGAYFVTLCAARKRSVFGRIEDGAMRLNRYGVIVDECWHELERHFPYVALDEWIIMPNHVHGIIFLEGIAPVDATVGARHASPLHDVSSIPCGAPARSLGAIIGAFKSAVTRRINLDRAEHHRAPVLVWQRNYHERIIRNEKELLDTGRYISENPLRWHEDVENPLRPAG